MIAQQAAVVGDLEAIVAEAVDKMKINLVDSLASCNKRYRKTGYRMSVLETMMNTKYFELHSQLQEFIKHSNQSVEAMQYFETECGKVRNEMITQYLQCKSAALSAALNSASFNLDYCIKNNVTYLPSQLNNHATSVQRHLLTTVSGWLEDSSSDVISTTSRNSVKDDFVAELQSVLNNDIEQYKRHLLSGKKNNKASVTPATIPVAPNKPVIPTHDEQVMSFIANLRNTVVTALQHSHAQNAPLVLEQVNNLFNSKYNELEASLSSSDSKTAFRKQCDALYGELSSELTRRPRSNSTATTSSDVGSIRSTSSLSSLANNLNAKAQLASRSATLPMNSPVSVFRNNNNINSSNINNSNNTSLLQQSSALNSIQLARNKRKSDIVSTADMSTWSDMDDTSFGSAVDGAVEISTGSTPPSSNSSSALMVSARRKPTTTSLFTGSVGVVESRKHYNGGNSSSSSTQMVLTPNKQQSISGGHNAMNSSSGGGSGGGNGTPIGFGHHASHAHSNNSAAVLHHSSSSHRNSNLSRENLIQAKRRKNEAVYNSTSNVSHPLVINSTFPTSSALTVKVDAKRAEEERISAMVNSCANRVNKKIIKGSGGKYALG